MKLCFLISISILAVLSLSHCAGADAMAMNQIQVLGQQLNEITAAILQQLNAVTAENWQHLNAEIHERKASQEEINEVTEANTAAIWHHLREVTEANTAAIWHHLREEIHERKASQKHLEAVTAANNAAIRQVVSKVHDISTAIWQEFQSLNLRLDAANTDILIIKEDLKAEIQELKDSQKVLREELRQEIQERKASQKDTTAIWEEIHSLNASLVSVEAFLSPNYITELFHPPPAV